MTVKIGKHEKPADKPLLFGLELVMEAKQE